MNSNKQVYIEDHVNKRADLLRVYLILLKDSFHRDTKYIGVNPTHDRDIFLSFTLLLSFKLMKGNSYYIFKYKNHLYFKKFSNIQLESLDNYMKNNMCVYKRYSPYIVDNIINNYKITEEVYKSLMEYIKVFLHNKVFSIKDYNRINDPLDYRTDIYNHLVCVTNLKRSIVKNRNEGYNFESTLIKELIYLIFNSDKLLSHEVFQ